MRRALGLGALLEGAKASSGDLRSLLEGLQVLRNIMTIHSPPSTSLGTKRSG